MLAGISRLLHRVREAPAARRFLVGASWSTGGAILASAISLAASIFVARSLGKDLYGQYIVVQTTMTTAVAFASFGIGTMATKYVAELQTRDPARLAKILGISQWCTSACSVLTIVGLIISAPFMAADVLNSPRIAIPLGLAAASVIFVSLDAFHKSILIGIGSLKLFAIITLAGSVIGFLTSVSAAHYFSLTGAAWGLSATAFAQCLVSRAVLNKQLRLLSLSIATKDVWGEWRVIRDFAFPTMIAGMLVGPAHWVCQALLANQPNGYSEVAILGVAMQWFNMVTLLPAVAARVLLPLLAESFAAGRHDQSAIALKLAVAANLVIALPIVMALALLSPRILAAYGSEFSTGSATLTLTAIVAILVVAVMPVGQTLAAEGRMWLSAGLNAGWTAVYIGCAVVFIRGGSFGVACALGLAYLCHSVWTCVFAYNHLSRAKVKLSA